MKYVEITLIICIMQLTVLKSQESSLCKPVKNTGLIKRIETIYFMPEISPFNTFKFHDSVWGNNSPKSKSINLTKEQKILAIKVSLKGYAESLANINIPNLMYADYSDVRMDKNIELSILQTIKNSPKLKVLSITDTSKLVSEVFDINWPTNTNIEALIIKKRFVSLGPNISKLKKLRFLSIQSPNLESLPETIGELTDLEDLEIVGNEADCISRLSELMNSRSDLSELGKVKSLPESFKNFKKLKRLVIHSGAITQLPIQILYCCNIQQLELYTPNLNEEIDIAKYRKLAKEGCSLIFGNLRQLILINSIGIVNSLSITKNVKEGIFKVTNLINSSNLSVFLFKSRFADVRKCDSLITPVQGNTIIFIPDNKVIEEILSEFTGSYSSSYLANHAIFPFGINYEKTNQLKDKLYGIYDYSPILQLEALEYKNTYLEAILPYEKEVNVHGDLKRLISYDNSCRFLRPLDSLFGKPIPQYTKGCIWGSGFNFSNEASQLNMLYFGGLCDNLLLNRLQFLSTAVNLKSLVLEGVPDSFLFKPFFLKNLTTACFNTYLTDSFAFRILRKSNQGQLPNLEALDWIINIGKQKKIYIEAERLFHCSSLRLLKVSFKKEILAPIDVTINYGNNLWFFGEEMEFSLRGLSSLDNVDLELSFYAIPSLKLDIPSSVLAQYMKKRIKQQNIVVPLSFSKELILDSCNKKSDWDIPFDYKRFNERNKKDFFNNHPLKKITLLQTKCIPSCLTKIKTLEDIGFNGVKYVDLSDSFCIDSQLKRISFKNVYKVNSLEGIFSINRCISLYIEDTTSLFALKKVLSDSPSLLDIYINFDSCKGMLDELLPIVANVHSFHLYNVTKDIPKQIIEFLKSMTLTDKPIFVDY